MVAEPTLFVCMHRFRWQLIIDFFLQTAFDTKGDAGANDFFESFDDTAAKQSGNDANNAFDAAFDTGAWGENGATEPAAADQAQEADTTPAVSQDTFEEPGLAGDDKNSSTDAQRKDRSRRRRAGGSSRSSRPQTGVESGVEAMNISDDGADKKERRARPSRAEDDKEHRRRRSTSRSRRKNRPPRDGGGVSGKKDESSSKPRSIRASTAKPKPEP